MADIKMAVGQCVTADAVWVPTGSECVCVLVVAMI
jgi:hypothetical protein